MYVCSKKSRRHRLLQGWGASVGARESRGIYKLSFRVSVYCGPGDLSRFIVCLN
jgi:hypothetical protein